jgi:hypothetical protein
MALMSFAKKMAVGRSAASRLRTCSYPFSRPPARTRPGSGSMPFRFRAFRYPR